MVYCIFHIGMFGIHIINSSQHERAPYFNQALLLLGVREQKMSYIVNLVGIGFSKFKTFELISKLRWVRQRTLLVFSRLFSF